MKAEVEKLIATAIQNLIASGQIPVSAAPVAIVERTREAAHGDFATNLALLLAKTLRQPPRELAKTVVSALPASALVEKIEIAGPGFVNFYLKQDAYWQQAQQIIAQGANYGRSVKGAGVKIQVEFVSANPTGPLHVGHGRGAAYGSVLSNLLEATGFTVQREYYVNDAGRQMDILAISVWIRYLELCGEVLSFPVNGYRGDYVWDIAATLHRTYGATFARTANAVLTDLPSDADNGGDKELFIDALIARTKRLLGEENYRTVFDLGLNILTKDIRDDLAQFGVNYDLWYSERSLTQRGAIEHCIARLQTAGHVYTQDGALWFRSSDFGDEKDRVLVRENGQATYFASDIAYHLDKIERGFDRMIDIWGADHHGYVTRVKAALSALGVDPNCLAVLLIQFAVLYRGQERVQMSTRSGEFVTLRALRHEVGCDAARFFYVNRSHEQHLDFDLDLAKSQSADNPVYYIQYAHARIRSVFRQAHEKGLTFDLNADLNILKNLTLHQEQTLLRNLSRYPEIVENAALQYAPHQLTHYLRNLANDFHSYYNAHAFLVENPIMRTARLNLIHAVEIVLRNGLNLLGVTAPENM